MLKKLHLLLFVIVSFCPRTWATVEIIDPLTFKYTDKTGRTTIRHINGYTRPENVEQYLLSAIERHSPTLNTDRDLTGRAISTVHVVQFSADPTGFVDQNENIGFIIVLNDGTTLLSLDFLYTTNHAPSTYDEALSQLKLCAHVARHGAHVGDISQGSLAPFSLFSTASLPFNQNLKDSGFRRNKKQTTRYQVTFLVPYPMLSGQGTIEITGIDSFEYTILEST